MHTVVIGSLGQEELVLGGQAQPVKIVTMRDCHLARLREKLVTLYAIRDHCNRPLASPWRLTGPAWRT